MYHHFCGLSQIHQPGLNYSEVEVPKQLFPAGSGRFLGSLQHRTVAALRKSSLGLVLSVNKNWQHDLTGKARHNPEQHLCDCRGCWIMISRKHASILCPPCSSDIPLQLSQCWTGGLVMPLLYSSNGCSKVPPNNTHLHCAFVFSSIPSKYIVLDRYPIYHILHFVVSSGIPGTLQLGMGEAHAIQGRHQCPTALSGAGAAGAFCRAP